ncbi:type VI secretion system contractile sheath small subunit [Niabella aquatica]
MNSTMSNNSENLVDIPANRTLLAGRFTASAAHKPEAIHGLQSLADIFQHYNPSVNVELEDKNGGVRTETFVFQSIQDFSMESITAQSSFFKELALSREGYLKAAQQLKRNGQLKEALSNPEQRKAFLSVVLAMIQDLKNSK